MSPRAGGDLRQHGARPAEVPAFAGTHDCRNAACAAASRAIGTRKGLALT
jgi:hypothetical protein